MHGAGDPPVTGCRDGFDTDRTPLSATQGRTEQTQCLARYHLLVIALGLPEHRVLDAVTYNAVYGAPRWQDRRNIRHREAVARAQAILQDDADKQAKVLDAETGQHVAPRADSGSRDDLARKVGF
jgi:hypothetical protein